MLTTLACSACGSGEIAPKTVVDTDELRNCIAATYGDKDPDASLARCEEKHIGTAWRKEPAPLLKDTPSMAGTGNLDPRIIQAGIEARTPRMRACDRAGLTRDPKLRGEVRVKFAIDSSGRAIRAEDDGSKLRDKQVVACVVGEFAALRFPRPEGSFVPVVYPMLFGPGDTYR
jgi:hypothetical protein